MKKFWEQLKPQERRAVAAVGIIFFVVLNYFMVWPQFKQWGLNKARIQKAEDNIKKYQAELVHKDEYARKIRNFDSDNPVPLEDQDIHFENYILDRMVENGVSRQNESPLRTIPANEFFVEKQVTIQTEASETGLVNFLYSLGSSNSMVRVKNLIVHTADINRYKLHADVVIVASYQKTKPNPPARPTVGGAKPEAAPAKPAVAPPNPAGTGPKTLNVTNKPGTPNTKRP